MLVESTFKSKIGEFIMCYVLGASREDNSEDVFILEVLDEVARLIDYKKEMGAAINFHCGHFPIRWVRPTQREIFGSFGMLASCLRQEYKHEEGENAPAFNKECLIEFEQICHSGNEIKAIDVARMIIRASHEVVRITFAELNLVSPLWPNNLNFGSKQVFFYLLDGVFSLFIHLLLDRATENFDSAMSASHFRKSVEAAKWRIVLIQSVGNVGNDAVH